MAAMSIVSFNLAQASGRLWTRIGCDPSLAISSQIANENKIKGDGKDWKAEAEKIDKEWREKYKARFFGKVDEGREESPEIDPEQKALKFEDLFKEE